MRLPTDGDFSTICIEIRDQVESSGTESLVWSDDQYQLGSFCGGWDPEHERFFFSYYAPDYIDYWFSISLADAQAVANGKAINPVLKPNGPAPQWP